MCSFQVHGLPYEPHNFYRSGMEDFLVTSHIVTAHFFGRSDNRIEILS